MADLGRVLGVIPARGGSKEVPKKNIRIVCGKPLISYTIEVAMKAQHLLYRTIVSTDDKEIASISQKYGAEVPFIRPKNLSNDQASMVPVLQHAVKYVERQDDTTVDWILLLQPTDPLRELADIEKGLSIAAMGDCDSVISVERVYSHHPALMKQIVNNRIVPFLINEEEGTPRQEYSPAAFMRNGSIYLTKRKNLLVNNSIWGQSIKPLVMKSGSRISIDSMNDLRLAEIMLSDRKGK